jgi:hypothetical protein
MISNGLLAQGAKHANTEMKRMDEYLQAEGRRLWSEGYNMTYVGFNQPKRPTTVKDVRNWLNENWTFGNEWAGFPENEMNAYYHSNKKLAYLWYWFDQTGTMFPTPE